MQLCFGRVGNPQADLGLATASHHASFRHTKRWSDIKVGSPAGLFDLFSKGVSLSRARAPLTVMDLSRRRAGPDLHGHVGPARRTLWRDARGRGRIVSALPATGPAPRTAQGPQYRDPRAAPPGRGGPACAPSPGRRGSPTPPSRRRCRPRSCRVGGRWSCSSTPWTATAKRFHDLWIAASRSRKRTPSGRTADRWPQGRARRRTPTHRDRHRPTARHRRGRHGQDHAGRHRPTRGARHRVRRDRPVPPVLRGDPPAPVHPSAPSGG